MSKQRNTVGMQSLYGTLSNKSNTPAHKEFTAPGVYTFVADGDFVIYIISVRLIHIDIGALKAAALFSPEVQLTLLTEI